MRAINTLRYLFSAVLLAAAATLALAQAMMVEVIPLRYRTAQEVVPILQPLVGREGSISGYQGQLILRTTAARLEEVKRLLATLDTPARQLLITVKQEIDIEAARRTAEISGRAGGEQGRIVIPPSSRDSRAGVMIGGREVEARAQVQDTHAASSDRSVQTVRATEGREAFIQVGVSVPVRERQVRRTVVGGHIVEQVVGGTQYRDVATGFHVLPRLTADRVTLDIRPQRESLSQGIPGAVDVQSMVTTVSGRLGEWIELGGVAQEAGGQQTVLLGRATGIARDIRRVLVKVEEIR